jgi:hypothetical protein
MEICLREIERYQQTGVEHNFIVLLGERQGWCPLPARIEAGGTSVHLSHFGGARRHILVKEN